MNLLTFEITLILVILCCVPFLFDLEMAYLNVLRSVFFLIIKKNLLNTLTHNRSCLCSVID